MVFLWYPQRRRPSAFSRILFLSVVLSLCGLVRPEPVPLPYSTCAPSTVTESNPTKRVNITAVYGQILHPSTSNDPELKLTAFGEIGNTLEGYSNTTGYLATLFVTTNYLSYLVFTNTSSLCDSLRPPSPLPPLTNTTTNYCPISAGDLAFGLSIPLTTSSNYGLKTLVTQIRIVDSSSPAHELTCLEVAATPLYTSSPTPQSGMSGIGLYGPWWGIFWATITLTVAYWLVTGLGRISAAWDRGLGRSSSGNKTWRRVQRAGFVVASALSGEKFSVSPALLRYVTPSARDLVLTTQWCATLGMIAVQWPDFAYPIFSTVAWSTLLSNTTLVSGSNQPGTWSPLFSTPVTLPTNFGDQLTDANGPLFLDQSVPNVLLTFPEGARNGMDKFVSSSGVLPQHAFGICLAIFLLIVGVVVLISFVITCVGWVGSVAFGGTKKAPHGREGKDAHAIEVEGRRTPWKRRFSLNSFHGSVTHGNLVRLLILFHLPITIYSCYHLTLSPSIAPPKTKVLAGLSFVVFSLLCPAYLLFRISHTSTAKLYEATRTLLALGPLYNQYQPKSQLFCALFFASNLVSGIVVGFGQKSGTAQAVIILVTEVVGTLATSVWLPWMSGAQMGVISFMFCVARIIASVLVVILAPPVNIGSEAAGWIAFGIFSVLGLMYVGFALMLLIKIFEGIVRLIRRVSFASSRHTLDSGLFGAMGCCGGSEHHRRRKRKRDARHSRAYSEAGTAVSGNSAYANRDAVNVSYLKPEQASMPYRESSDDDTGFIMESWSKTDLGLEGGRASGSSAAARSKSRLALDDGTTEEGVPASTGFARVGGGRAHIDTPYSILKGKGPQQQVRTTSPPITSFANAPPATPKPVSKSPDPLPKGAARPIHSRTRSQTAVIEDASTLLAAGGAAIAGGSGGGSGSRPGSSGTGAHSRPGSAGKNGSHLRPGSSGKQGTKMSRPASGTAMARPSSRDQVYNRQNLLSPDEFGAGAGKSGSSSKGKGRGWFGLGGSSPNDSSSDEEEEKKSRQSKESKKGWGFKKRRNSESDMSPFASEGTSPPVENRSFVVIRNKPPNLGLLPKPEPFIMDNSAGGSGWAGVDQVGSPLPESHLGVGSTMTLANRTPDQREDSPLVLARGQSPPPPSSYNPPRQSRRMSSPSA